MGISRSRSSGICSANTEKQMFSMISASTARRSLGVIASVSILSV